VVTTGISFKNSRDKKINYEQERVMKNFNPGNYKNGGYYNGCKINPFSDT